MGNSVTEKAKRREGSIRRARLDVPTELWKKARIAAAERDTTIREVIIAAVESYLKTTTKA